MPMMKFRLSLGLFFCLCPFLLIAKTSVQIIAVGDVLLHKPVQHQGIRKGFASLWLAAIPKLKQADVTYGNLEGPSAEMLDAYGKITSNWNEAYTSFPMFNYPPTLLAALKLSGFDVLSTANNHCLDRRAIGIDKTIEVLNQNGLAFTGTRSSQHANPWFAETRTHDIAIAWLACTQDSNGMTDHHQQVLQCHRDKSEILSLIRDLSRQYDAVIVTPHWGIEYETRPNQTQQHLAYEFAQAGALAILGSHPHSVQPFTWIEGLGSRKVFVAYSLGNFISNQGSLKNRSSGLLSLQLEKENGTTRIKTVSYHPTYMENRNGNMHLTLISSKKHPAYRWLKQIISEQYLALP
ncbi:CapA family protein [Legionella jordanis]|nr:CapA family protein [Legionella jordanis]RMX21289.1 CapA family protein [Legionella jordanis]